MKASRGYLRLSETCHATPSHSRRTCAIAHPWSVVIVALKIQYTGDRGHTGDRATYFVFRTDRETFLTGSAKQQYLQQWAIRVYDCRLGVALYAWLWPIIKDLLGADVSELIVGRMIQFSVLDFWGKKTRLTPVSCHSTGISQRLPGSGHP